MCHHHFLSPAVRVLMQLDVGMIIVLWTVAAQLCGVARTPSQRSIVERIVLIICLLPSHVASIPTPSCVGPRKRTGLLATTYYPISLTSLHGRFGQASVGADVGMLYLYPCHDRFANHLAVDMWAWWIEQNTTICTKPKVLCTAVEFPLVLICRAPTTPAEHR